MAKGKKTGGGSRKGRPNKLTADLRAMVREAVEQEGGVEYLRQQARDNPGPFLALLGKCLPREVEVGQAEPFVIRWADA